MPPRASTPIADPITGLILTGLILHSTWESWQTILAVSNARS
ncbi:MAG TPA: hypothetical protein VHO29_04750 [Marmoricola sp.]|nr:hypothetical protein [Marmoricola sp.]